ncbi:MAG TPA: universal stress protein [Candidatus Acidoferrales bacterium]|nr:universal stress protein [Candidatus Acidoferrales bacterium]
MESEHVFKKILYPTDGSDPGLLAQELAILLAKKLESEVTVFHVVTHELMQPHAKAFLFEGRTVSESPDAEPGAQVEGEMSFDRETPTSAGAHSSERIEDELTSIYRQQGEDIVADSMLTFKEEGVHADQKVVQRKSVAEAVMEEAERGKYDLIVIGRNAQKEKEAHLGSVAYKVSRQSDIPVLVAGEKAAEKITKILVPVDGSESSENALRYAAALCNKLNAALTLLHVQESHLFSLRPHVSTAIGKGILADAAEKLKGTNLEQKLESGDPAKKISEIAGKENFDLIVMGSDGVSNHVLHYTMHSVLIVK